MNIKHAIKTNDLMGIKLFLKENKSYPMEFDDFIQPHALYPTPAVIVLSMDLMTHIT